MAFENLSDREKQVLENLVTYYIQSADPVGSRVIANRSGIGLSPATIRNTLQDLEELGLIQQPHTSAGRIPTDLGYRVYVDYLLKPEGLSVAEQEAIKSGLTRDGIGVREVLGQTCKVISELTRELGVSISQRFENSVLKRIDLIPVASDRVMVVVILSSGIVRSLIMEVQATVPEGAIRELESTLNERLSGLTIAAVRDTIGSRLSDVSGHGRLIKLLVESKDLILADEKGGEIRVAGADNLLSQPEFTDRNKVSALVRMLEDGTVLADFLEDSPDEGIVITIGNENKVAHIMNCSVVSSSYRVGELSGSIGVMGPTRMPYNKLVSVVEYTARAITEVLGGKKRRKEMP